MMHMPTGHAFSWPTFYILSALVWAPRLRFLSAVLARPIWHSIATNLLYRAFAGLAWMRLRSLIGCGDTLMA